MSNAAAQGIGPVAGAASPEGSEGQEASESAPRSGYDDGASGAGPSMSAPISVSDGDSQIPPGLAPAPGLDGDDATNTALNIIGAGTGPIGTVATAVGMSKTVNDMGSNSSGLDDAYSAAGLGLGAASLLGSATAGPAGLFVGGVQLSTKAGMKMADNMQQSETNRNFEQGKDQYGNPSQASHPDVSIPHDMFSDGLDHELD